MKMTASHFQISDTKAAAFLLAHDATLIGSRLEAKQVCFLFAKPEKCEQLLLEFHNNGSVRVGDYLRSLDALRDLLFSRLRTASEAVQQSPAEAESCPKEEEP